MDLEKLVATAADKGASDLILSPGSPPTVRVSGQLAGFGDAKVQASSVDGFLRLLLDDDAIRAFRKTLELDFPALVSGVRLRANAYFTRGEPALALRLIPPTIPHPDQLGLPISLVELVRKAQGLVLFTGAAGQGKTTSQASLVDVLNRSVARHIVTIEDPIEFLHEPNLSIVDQREIGVDTLSFADGLKHVMRQNPDVILVGEMRDRETMKAALTVAETGHLVMSTVHANDSCQTIDRIVDAFPAEGQSQIRSQLSLTLRAVVNQRLVRNRGGKLVLAAEVLMNSPAVAKLIRDGRTSQLYSTMEIEGERGSVSMNHALERLVASGNVFPAEIKPYMSELESRGHTA